VEFKTIAAVLGAEAPESERRIRGVCIGPRKLVVVVCVLLFSVLVGIPLGLRALPAGQAILVSRRVVQTVLLGIAVFFDSLFGVGRKPAAGRTLLL